jgi:hypothetical protein
MGYNAPHDIRGAFNLYPDEIGMKVVGAKRYLDIRKHPQAIRIA